MNNFDQIIENIRKDHMYYECVDRLLVSLRTCVANELINVLMSCIIKYQGYVELTREMDPIPFINGKVQGVHEMLAHLRGALKSTSLWPKEDIAFIDTYFIKLNEDLAKVRENKDDRL